MFGRGQTKWLIWLGASLLRVFTALCDVTAGGFFICAHCTIQILRNRAREKKAIDGRFLVTEGQKKGKKKRQRTLKHVR